MIGSTSWVVPGTYFDNAKLLEEIVDFVELLVYDWSDEVRNLLLVESEKLLRLDLAYTVHLPTNNVSDAKEAFDFFEEVGFPVLNYVLHPLEGWRYVQWNDRISVENLMGRIDVHSRMVFDVGHHILGERFPDELIDNIVEVHLMGVKEGRDHMRLDEETAIIASRFVRGDTLVNFEVFDLDDLLHSIKVWQNVRPHG